MSSFEQGRGSSTSSVAANVQRITLGRGRGRGRGRGGTSSSAPIGHGSGSVLVSRPPPFPSGHGSDTSMNNSASDAASQTGAPISRQKLTIVKQTFMPQHYSASTITSIFKGSMPRGGFSWGKVREEKKVDYFEEFKKYFTWEDAEESAIFKLWRVRAAIRYKDMICTAKGEYLKEGKKADFIPDDHWDEWKAYWNRDDVKQKAKTAKMCRLTEPEGPGTGIVRHRGGSRSAQQYAAILSKEHNVPEEEVEWQVFLQLHCKNGEYTDPKSKRIAERVYELAAERRQPLPNTTEEREVDMTKIFIEVSTQNSNKGRLFGTGCRAALYRGSDSGGTSNVNTQMMTEQLTQLQTELQSERDGRLALEEQVKKQADEHARMKEQLDLMMQQWRSSQGSPPP